MSWSFPFDQKKVGISADSDSFQDIDLSTECLIPIDGHLGAFGTQRKHHRHEGVDLYCNPGESVHAVESGVVVNILPFTGPSAGSEWWNDTKAVMVEGESGVVCYGEIEPRQGLEIGSKVSAGEEIGVVVQVLKHNKGRPMSMLHLELYEHGTTAPVEWGPNLFGKIPEHLLNPTPTLLEALKK